MSKKIQLGSEALYPDHYDASLLNPIARNRSRESIAKLVPSIAPMFGVDIWTAYEVSWLDASGMPRVALAEFRFDINSPNIIESKSFKYYLNSFNQTRIESLEKLKSRMIADLSNSSGCEVVVRLVDVNKGLGLIDTVIGKCIDDIDIETNAYSPEPEFLTTSEQRVQNEQVFSHLLKTNCPVTGQPDWATLWVEYSGRLIDYAGLLKYIVSFRGHQDFHEHCVERMFQEVWLKCAPEKLSVYARYTRRGGLDINPFRTSQIEKTAPRFKSLRQ